jgi:heme exporter protein D
MNWASAADFFAMGGRGFYVWSSFGVTALILIGEMVALRARRRGLQRTLAERFSQSGKED